MKRILMVLMLSLGASSVARAHAIHTTHTTITADARGYTLTIRAFADDLSATVARFSGRTPPADSSVRLPELLAYTSARLALVNASGIRFALTSCGVQRMDEAYVMCFRIATTPQNGASLRLGNQMLVELHADQVNIVQCSVAGTRRTSLFTRGRAPAIIVNRGVCADR